MSQDISTALELIVGKTIRDRTEGMRMLQDALKRDSVVNNIDERGDGKAWLYIFQKVFPLVLDEREKYMKSSGEKTAKRTGTDAAARLERAANFVRWLTERSVSNLNRRVIRPLIAHLTQMIIHNGTVFLPVALSYVKALRTIVEFRPHMDHLDGDTWSHLMAVSFAAVLDARLSHSLTLEDLSDTAGSNAGELDDEAEAMTGPRRKRQRIMSPPASATSTNHLKSARLDQIEFVALIRALLAHPNASFMMTSVPGAPQAILGSFSRYFIQYPSEGTAHQDAIWGLNSALLSLELNRSQEIIKFGAQLWFPLLDLWTTKTRAIKEGLVLTFNLLMPLMMESDNSHFPKADAIARLGAALDGEPGSRSGLEGLSLDALRLQLSQDRKIHGAFETSSFRHGADFGPSHALSWVALQLQADCIAKMLVLTGSMSDTPRRGGKSLRLSNPVLSLLSQIKAIPSARNYRLQVLLFLIDRHWDRLSPPAQTEVCSTLSAFFSQDDHTSSSWAFICCAAIACAQEPASRSISPNQISEEITGFWTHAIRKTSVTLECRAACHVANAVVRNGHLDDQALFKDVEAFAADLLVQGPAFPHDSVCAFLIECLRVASRDAGLYRKQLEDKVLGWLSESWNVTETVRNNARVRLDTYSLADILELLQTSCVMTRRILPVAVSLLPDCTTTEVMLERHQSNLIRDFLIYAQLPAFHPNGTSNPGTPDTVGPSPRNTAEIPDNDLTVPNDRARKSSAFLLKSLDALLVEWDSAKDTTLMSREAARRAADLACLALWFEASLVSDGMRANTRVIKAACSLVQQIIPCISAPRWTTDERATMLLPFDVLINDGEDTVEHTPWKGILDPDVGTGIKRRALAQMMRQNGSTMEEEIKIRRGLLQKIWRSSETKDTFVELSRFLRQSIHDLKPPNPGEEKAAGLDADGFSEIRTVNSEPNVRAADSWTTSRASGALISFATRFLTAVPAFQSPKLEPTRERDVLELLQSCDGPAFFTLAPAVFECIRRQYLHMSHSDLETTLDHLGELLKSYAHPRCEKMQLVLISFLESTMSLWIRQDNAEKDFGIQSRVLLHWLSEMLVTQKIISWKARDKFTVLMSRYIALDPQQSIWSTPSSDDTDSMSPEYLPGTMLVNLGTDFDVRVRVRAAEATAGIFRSLNYTDTNPMAFYQDVRAQLSISTDDFEGMLTRFLALGNVMVVSSSVRRGPYWHLLETCYHSAAFSRHMESVLVAVADRMGLTSLSQLFEAYASQIAFSTCLAQKDLAHIPSHLLGYKSMEQRIEESFRLVGPTLLLVGGLREPVSHGIKQFQSLCKTIGISESQGLRNCFHDVIGLSIVFYHEESLDEDTHRLSQEATADLKDVLLKRANDACPPDEVPQDYLIRVAPQIVVSIARTINGAPDEDIVSAFQLQAKGNAAKDFETFQYYWGDDDFPVHDPVLPAFRPQTVIASLFWFLENHSALFVESHLAYHVAHHLFTAINRSPLVNEQLRLLRALSVVVASLKPFRKDWTLLRTLIHGYSLLLTQPDLARMAQSALDWCLSFVPKHVTAITSSSPKLEVLGRMGRIAYDYTRETDEFMRHLGGKLMDWVEGVTAKLEKQASGSGDAQNLHPQILNVLALWPRELKYSELVLRAEELDSDNMSYILQNYASNASKFRTVHRLLSITHQDTHQEDARQSTFAKADFWHLKSCIPSGDEMQSEDAAAFAELLFLNKGNVRALTSERHDAHSVDAIHRSYATKNKRDSTSPLSAILIVLFDLVYSEDASKVFTAYQTIGRLSSLEVDLAGFSGSPSISRGVQQERAFYPRHADTPLTVRPRSLDELLVAEDLKSSAANYSSWVRTLSSYFCAVLSTIKSQEFFAQLVDIIRTDEIIAKQLLPVLIHAILQHEDHQLGIPKDQYDAETARSRISSYFTELLTRDSISTSIIDCLILVMLHLRNFYPLSGMEPRDMLACDHWLDIDYRLLAEGALRCGAYTTGILFLELHEDRIHDFPDDSVTRSTEEILYDIYSHIDEPDGFYGIRGDDIQSHLIRRFHHEGRWDKAFQFLGAMFESPGASASSTPGVLHSLQSFGFENMAMTMINGSKDAQVPPTDDGYTLGWRTETWDLPVSADNLPPGSALYYALRAVHQERDPAVAQLRLYDARRSEMERLRALGSEDMSHIKKSIRALMCIGEVRKFLDHPQDQKGLRQTFTPLSPDFEFEDYESLVATRLSLLRANIHKNRAMQIGDIDSEDTKKLLEYEQDLLIKLSQAARDSQKNQVALNSIIRAGNGAQKNEFEFIQEYASVMWAKQEQKTAVGFLRQFLGRPEDKHKRSSKDVAPFAQLLSLLGTWVSDARLEQPMDIREKYFGRAEKMLQDLLHQHPSHAIVYHRYAKFAEEQYDTALKLSPEVRRLKARMDRKKNELTQIGESLRRSVGNAQLTQQQRKSQALLKADTEQFDRHIKSQRVFLEQAIEMYARCLVTGDSENNDTIIRFCSLWFANFSDSALNMSVLRGALQQIPSHKFVFLAHQISARLSTTSDPSHSNIRTLMARLCRDHPFHTLYQVYALASASAGGALATPNRRQSRAAVADSQSQTKRDEAARTILEKLQRDETVGKRVIQFIQLCNACLQWAKYSLKQDKALKDSKNKMVPQHMELAKLKDLDVPVSTAFTPIDVTCRYEDNIVRLTRYGSRFSTAGGINLPKINDCIGEDGERYKQLFKGEGEDDLRQDAVMEQVFELCNILLKRDRSSKRRNLRVRTYKVIPLASQAGLLEFVTNTMPIGSWLLNAHKKYNPKDWQPPVCTDHLRKARATGKPQALLDIFMEIRKHFRPVMRHFFTETHKLPTAWFDMRLNYQRAVATTSIVGHVLGLGDRHLSNILIHNTTGEVVHIDLGIAFDQGRLLPIPETVPFRLTADIVDGLGSTGTEGVFRRCAEETLRVLRDQASVIKTILEVFNHDPLHSWSAAPVKIKHIQGTADTDIDGMGLDSAEAEAADRALSSVARKLDTSMSVEYTVNDLIATATDPANLSQLFVGWNPHV